MAVVERKSGFYWVVLYGDDAVCEWDNQERCWYIPGYESEHHDIHFSKIDEKRITRD